jgi:5-methylcytosine-specific restriction endonuclease McrA
MATHQFKLCEACDKPIVGDMRPSRLGKRRFCSGRCSRSFEAGKPKVRAVRICKKCGLPGVKKSRNYHPECSPYGTKGMLSACIDCGLVRRVYPDSGRSQVYCRKCSLKRKGGANNANWKGGITPVNMKIRASEEYKAWRLAVFNRDEYTCVWCGQVGGKLHADHIQPFSTHPDLRLELSNGRTLCIPCHMKTNSYLAKALKKKRRFKQITFVFGDE